MAEPATEVKAGFQEVEHTADWALEIWAPTLAQLFEQAARGMLALTGIELAAQAREIRQLDLLAIDLESLLVNFLNELLFWGENEYMAFDDFHLTIEGTHLTGWVEGAPIAAQTKEIKAVTYHNLVISHSAGEFRVRIVLDV
ncbi:MAG: archease [Anaerolineales bacterium]|jgi:SHS2 domain-containing protein